MSIGDAAPGTTRILVIDPALDGLGRRWTLGDPRPVVASWPFECADPASWCDVDRLARLELAARRMGLTVCVQGPTAALADLLDLAGLAAMVVAANLGSGLEPVRQAEEREELG